MRNYRVCPGCKNPAKATEVYECRPSIGGCGEIFCRRCAGGLTTVRCPVCQQPVFIGSVVQIGVVGERQPPE